MLARGNWVRPSEVAGAAFGATRPATKMLRFFLLPALATALQLSTFAPVSTGRAARATAGVWMQEVEASIEVSSDAEASMDMAAAVPEQNERFKAISLNALDEWAEKFPRLLPEVQDIKLASLIFPFKALSSPQRAQCSLRTRATAPSLHQPCDPFTDSSPLHRSAQAAAPVHLPLLALHLPLPTPLLALHLALPTPLLAAPSPPHTRPRRARPRRTWSRSSSTGRWR